MGPTGELIVPLGTLTMDDARAAFAEQAPGWPPAASISCWWRP